MLNGDHLLDETCSWESFTAVMEDSHYQPTETYAAAVTLDCLRDSPGSKWQADPRGATLRGDVVLWLPQASTVKPKDRITYAGNAYRVVDVSAWPDCFSALCERIQGVS